MQNDMDLRVYLLYIHHAICLVFCVSGYEQGTDKQVDFFKRDLWGVNALASEATLSEMFLPSMTVRVIERKEFAPEEYIFSFKRRSHSKKGLVYGKANMKLESYLPL